MIIKEVDFNNIAEFHDNKVEPVFMQYGKECFEFPISLNQIENLWPIFQKLFYYKLYYIDHQSYDRKYLLCLIRLHVLT